VVENVVEMMAWKLYRAWRFAMQALGYAISENVVDAADFGIPQHRVRLLIVCVLGKYAFHLKKPRSTIVTARDVIDFEFGRWSAVHRKGRAAATLSRYATGRKRFGERFVMPFYGSGSGTTGRSLDRPIGTITTRDRWAVVDGDRMRMVSVSEAAAFMSFPSSYQLPESSRLAMHMLGNAVPPRMACEAIRQILRSA
jgi:DNA (cytosine-5)-methyltransferase 1